MIAAEDVRRGKVGEIGKDSAMTTTPHRASGAGTGMMVRCDLSPICNGFMCHMEKTVMY